MQNVRVAGTDLDVSNVVLGMMRIAERSDEQIRELVAAAIDSGVNMIDHADVYGGMHGCEKRFGDAVRLTPEQRDRLVIQSKVGIQRGYYDFSREHILASVDGSLAALRTDRLDVLLLHRPDTLVEPDEVAAAFDELETAGKVRHFGVSNHTPGQIELLKKSVRQPLRFNQVQVSPVHASLFATGIAANIAELDQSTDRDNGLLDYSRLHDITLQAWSPFQKGMIHGPFLGDREEFGELNDVLEELAAQYGVTPAAIVVAWITRHPARFQVVLGTTTPSRVTESAAGSALALTRPEWYRVFRAGGNRVP